MPRSKKKAHEMTADEVMKRIFTTKGHAKIKAHKKSLERKKAA
jgi:hypothetical protein